MACESAACTWFIPAITPRVSCSAFIQFFFFFNDTATTEIYTLSLHDALPIFVQYPVARSGASTLISPVPSSSGAFGCRGRSEEHTSELQSRRDLVCRLLLEKKNS